MKILFVIFIILVATDKYNMAYLFPKFYYWKKIKKLQQRLDEVDKEMKNPSNSL